MIKVQWEKYGGDCYRLMSGRVPLAQLTRFPGVGWRFEGLYELGFFQIPEEGQAALVKQTEIAP